MLRITHSGYMTVATIDLEGKLVGPWVEELRRTIGSLQPEEAKRLNLAGLAFADTAGLRLLLDLRRGGVDLVGAMPLIEGLLALQGNADTVEMSAVE